MEDIEKLKQIDRLIDVICDQNFCSNRPDILLQRLYNDLTELQFQLKLEDKQGKILLINNCIEAICLLQEIICIDKDIKE